MCSRYPSKLGAKLGGTTAKRSHNREVIVLRKYIIPDLIRAWLLLAGCLIAGLIVNKMRSAPLPWVYSSTESRLKQPKIESKLSAVVPVAEDGDVDVGEMQKISLHQEALIIDARPENEYRLGHIPSAVSLPRDDFDRQYPALQSVLQSYRNKPIIVYCSNFRCADSQIVAVALQRLGYQQVRLFRGGWKDWERANLPAERE